MSFLTRLFLPKVFIGHVPGNAARGAWLKQVVKVWGGYGCTVSILIPSTESPFEFQRVRRMKAEAEGGSIYVLADDDCLPMGQDFVAEMVAALKRHPGYAMLAPLPDNENINEWTPPKDEWKTANDDEVMEHVSIGGIRFCRKDAMRVWPRIEGAFPAYDGVHGHTLRQRGLRVGYVRNTHFLHLGKDQSTVWGAVA